MFVITHNLYSGHLKNDFGEVDEAMFLCVQWPSSAFSASGGLKKLTWIKYLIDVLNTQMALRTNNLSSERLKMLLL
jgi:hypothetical protein